MSDYYPNTKTIYGSECKLYEKPLPGRKCSKRLGTCNHECSSRSCDACGMTVEGYVYHSSKKNWDFHIRCTELPSAIRIGGFIFTLERKETRTKCVWCNERLVKGGTKKIHGWSYVSKEHGYIIHVNCVEMPKQLNNATSSNAPNLELGFELNPNGSNDRGAKWGKIFKPILSVVVTVVAAAFGAST